MALRKKIVAGNWKMHASRCEAANLVRAIKQGVKQFTPPRDIILFPSFVHLQFLADLLSDTQIALGGQNLYLGKAGAFTGEISGPMLKDYGCRYVLVGHSERRHLFHEDLYLVAEKFKAAKEAGLIPVLCVGETLAQYHAGHTEVVIREQLASVIEAASMGAFQEAVIAYEPVWAIGTGLTAEPDYAQTIHAFIRHQIAEQDTKIASNLQILYGGSIKADNAKKLFSMPDIDGGLVGGASLEADSFLQIIKA